MKIGVPTGMLREPADADRFRIKRGRYGDRWYHDPLPADDRWPATSESWPSMSAVKQAWPKWLNKWIAESVARRAVADWQALSLLDDDARFAVLAASADSNRDRAAARGTAIHNLIDRTARGLPTDDEVWDDEAALFVPVVHKLLTDLAPEWLFNEAVIISRTHGIGGTADCGWRLDGRNYMVDFKTRLTHACYDDEGVQVAGYASADYMIVEVEGAPRRAPLPDFDAGLIVSITPDSFELYPIDLEHATEAFKILRRFWQVQQERDIVGKPIYIPVADSTNDAGLRAEYARQRLIRIFKVKPYLETPWPTGVPTFRYARENGYTFNPIELDLIDAALSAAEAEIDMPFDDGPPDADPDRVAALRERAEQLPANLGVDVDLTGPVNVTQLAHIEPVVAQLEAQAADRKTAVLDMLGDFIEDLDLCRAILQLAGVQRAVEVTPELLPVIVAVCAAIDRDIIELHYEITGKLSLQLSPNAEAVILKQGNGSKAAALVICKDAARKHGRPVPRSVSAALDDLVLVALVATQNLTDTTTGATEEKEGNP